MLDGHDSSYFAVAGAAADGYIGDAQNHTAGGQLNMNNHPLINVSYLSFNQGSNHRISTNASGLIFDGGDGTADFLVYDERGYIDNLVMGYGGGATLSTYDSNENLTIDPQGSGNIILNPDSNGKVGIGTTTPSAKLDVKDGAVLFEGTNGGTPVSGAGSRFM